MAKVMSRLAAQLGSFEEASLTLEEDYGVHLAKETVRAVAEGAGQHMLAQEDAERQRVMERQARLPDLPEDLWEGHCSMALELVQADRTKVRSSAKREALHELEIYLENNLSRMDHPRYRALGLPVGSGRVEAQCKTLVAAAAAPLHWQLLII